jgi:hypothetical protein
MDFALGDALTSATTIVTHALEWTHRIGARPQTFKIIVQRLQAHAYQFVLRQLPLLCRDSDFRDTASP